MRSNICSNCRNQLREGAQFCFQCGSAVPAAEAPAEGRSASAAVTSMSPDATTCIRCGSPLRNGAKFCRGCGATVATAQAPNVDPPPLAATPENAPTRVSSAPTQHPPASAVSSMGPDETACAQCGSPLREGAKFCRGCGAAVATAQAPPEDRPPLDILPRGVPTGLFASPVQREATSAKFVADSEAPARSRLRDPRLLAAGGGLLLLVIAVGLVLALAGNSSKPTATTKQTRAAAAGTTSGSAQTIAPATTSATAPSTTAPGVSTATATGTTTSAALPGETANELASLDSILNLAEAGRRSLANGDITATIANRREVLQQLGALHPNSELSASVQALDVAESFSLQADTTCGLSCPPSTNARSTQLKKAFVAIFDPIATRYGTPTYAADQI